MTTRTLFLITTIAIGIRDQSAKQVNSELNRCGNVSHFRAWALDTTQFEGELISIQIVAVFLNFHDLLLKILAIIFRASLRSQHNSEALHCSRGVLGHERVPWNANGNPLDCSTRHLEVESMFLENRVDRLTMRNEKREKNDLESKCFDKK